MSEPLTRAGLTVAAPFAAFVEQDLLPPLGIDAGRWWQEVADIFDRFAPENRALLASRDTLQAQIDARYERGAAVDEAFLREIGYLVPEPGPFTIGTTDVDAEIATMAGPQLVVPVLNARFLLNAANARWGSLYDAFYGTDALPGIALPGGYDPVRGERVVDRVKAFLGTAIPLADRDWADYVEGPPDLADPAQCIARTDGAMLFRHNGLHIAITIDHDHPIGREDPAGIADVTLEAALTTIVDFEDSVAAVDAVDKVATYANWLGLMRGDLVARFDKLGAAVTRTLAPDREIAGVPLPGRSLLFVRTTGLLMTTPTILLPDGSEAPEGILDTIVAATAALYDLRGLGAHRNSRAGSVYLVKPKLHGPDEAAFTNRLFDAVEDLLDLPRHTIKIGVMDEERRTSANLAACIAAVRHRIVFINTGFLDRTGDEIHTAMRAGPMIRKGEMKAADWIAAYEDRNVRIGLACGLSGRAQIGKGMWAAPDRMGDMLAQKIAHPQSGANTAWVPSPTAATLHAMHYHQIDVFARQAVIAREAVPPLSHLLTTPVAKSRGWTAEDIHAELDTNVQAILGYVVRWIDQGIGCSKVPDLHDIGLMEDRATLRIASQHIANWLLHGIVGTAEVEAAFERMAAKVDVQNLGDPLYQPMAGQLATSLAYQAAHALVFEGTTQPNGYTEPLLHRYRREAKTMAAIRAD
jgi:malate synthase